MNNNQEKWYDPPLLQDLDIFVDDYNKNNKNKQYDLDFNRK